MGSLLQDVRYGLRALARMPGTVALAIVTLGLGIAATTTMATIVYATVFRPVPFPDSDSLVVLNILHRTSQSGTARLRWSYPEFTALRSSVRSFEALGAFTASATVGVGGADGARTFRAELVSSGYFRALRTRVRSGRMFDDGEESPG